ncbi:peptide methionine sulfoxide reductase MsrA [Halorubrum trapanicum]|uniref:peptide-methionine (S)-S-oxide reductase n=1 Tax=Halorubrum trapanicum TaxID=29284 RepID=A0A8J7R6K8_9EURY|nr:peptide methionine sulfoxide reductase MsrA [Halorubrum trapanicum]
MFQVEFDPDTITYRDLLNLVFESHTPHHQTRNTQCQNVVLTATGAQQATLEEFLLSQGFTADGIGTRIEQLSRFSPAEDYHHKYKLRAVSSLMDAFDAADYDDEALRGSLITATLNGYAAGHDVALVEEPSASG